MLDRLKSLRAQGKLGAAEATFSRIVAETPGHLHAWLGLGYCLSLNGDADAALRTFEKAVGLGPSDDETAIDCSNALSHLGELDAARGVLAARPETSRLQMALGELEERHGNFGAALIRYRAVHERDPASDFPLKKMIRLHCRCGAFSTALATADRLAAIGEQYAATAWQFRGQIRSAMNQRGAAIAAFRMGLKLAPLSEPIAIDLARELRQLRKDDEARTLLESLPATYGVLLALGDLDLSCRHHAEALRQVEAARSLEPSRPEPLARIARIEADRGNYDAAWAAVAKMEACGAEHRPTMLRSRLALFKAEGDERSALNTLLDLVAHQPADAGLLAELARQYRVIGEPAAARKTIDAALAQDPQSVAVLTEAGEQASQVEDRDIALVFYQRALAAAPEQIWHHLRVARLLYDLNRLDEAEEALRTAEGRFGASAEILGERIRILREAGESYPALQSAREAQTAHPAHFGRWSDRFELELRLSPLETVRECIDLAPVQNCQEEAQLLCARARLALRACDTNQAFAQFQSALALRPRHHGALNGLFQLHLRRFDIEQASSCLARLAVHDAPSRRMRGATTNASQSHDGQLLNDLMLDRRAANALAAIQTSDPAIQVEILLPLIKHRPNHIPTAQALLVALQAGGFFNPRVECEPVDESPVAIPQHIAQFWDRPDPPRDLLELSESWRDKNPTYRYSLFNDETAQDYLGSHFPQPVVTAYRRCSDPTTRADLFRLAFLAHEGGTWADMDDRCLAPLSHLIRRGVEAFFWQESSGHLCNNLIAAIPHHPVMRRALVTAVNAINRGDRDKVWMLTGPGLLSRAFAAEMAEAGEAWGDWLGRIAILDEFDIHPFVAIHCRTSHKRLGKHWHRTAYASPGQRSKLTRVPERPLAVGRLTASSLISRGFDSLAAAG
jgi:tetratricopeptide (TPR) repeat protein